MTYTVTAAILEDLAVYGTAPAEEKASWDAPDADHLHTLAEHLIDNIAEVFADSCLELDTSDVLWNLVNVFHRKAQKLEHALDTNILRQRALSEQQDGSEIASHELETAHAEGISIQNRLTAMETLREHSAEVFMQHTGDVWMPRSGSMIHRTAMTASMIDARDFANAQKLVKSKALLPEGKKIIFAGGNCSDITRIYAVLDKTREKLAERGEQMVLVHGGGKGAEHIAATWAKNRNVQQIVFKPDWTKHSKAAPFKRNDVMLALLPHGLIMVNPDSGIHQQLLREAKRLGITIKIA